MPKVPVVLLVEDEALIGEMVAEALADYGYRVHIAERADQALAYLNSGGAADLLFTDINLPGEMDGAALAVAARLIRPDLPVIYASGRWQLLERLGLESSSVVLRKPYSPARACFAVESLLMPKLAAG